MFSYSSKGELGRGIHLLCLDTVMPASDISTTAAVLQKRKDPVLGEMVPADNSGREVKGICIEPLN